MKNRYTKPLVVIGWLACSVGGLACQPSHERETKKLGRLLATYRPAEDLGNKVLMVMNLGGCEGCSREAKRCLAKHLTHPNLRCIVGAQMAKEIRLEFTDSLRRHPHFVWDSLGLARAAELVKIGHPVLYYCERGQVVRIADFTYQNAGAENQAIEAFLGQTQ